MKRILGGLVGAAIMVAMAGAALAQDGQKLHALTFGDAPKYGPDFKQLDYVNPDAPKGGTVKFSAFGGYDTFNPYVPRGDLAPGLGYVFETLTTSPDDDSLGEYGLIAESMELAQDRTWIQFNLRPEARWHDGKPITADDVVFSFNILKEKGNPFYRFYYADVTNVEKIDDHSVKFTFRSGDNRELPIIMGQLPVLPKHYWEGKAFDEPTLTPPLGSGPYKIDSFEPGRSVTLRRVDDWWGKDLPINRGRYNYDVMRFDLYRDLTVAREAFKGGAFDFNSENSAKAWATAYDTPAIKDGRIIKETLPDANPDGMQCYVYNIRRPIFADRKTREALSYAFDFEWSNKALFYGQYQRSRSFFENSEMAASGLPSPEELKILEPFKGKIPDEVFTAEYNPPKTDGSGSNRDNLTIAAKLLDEAGWKVENGKRMRNGQELTFEILLYDAQFERITEPFIRNLEKIGVSARLRTVDSAQYQERLRKFDFDMINGGFGQSLSPGNEQRDFWGSAAADQPDSRNVIGIKDPAIDSLVDQLIAAPTRKDLIVHTQALDRVLQWGFYVIPQWHYAFTRIAFWDKFGRPAKLPDPAYGIGSTAWWIDPAKEAALKSKMPSAAPAASSEPAPAATQSGAAQPAAPAPAGAAESDRGKSPIMMGIYGLGILAAIAIAFAIGRSRRK